MKKKISTLILSGVILLPTCSAFASEVDFPYVEDLGYEVNLDMAKENEELSASDLQYVEDLGYEVDLDALEEKEEIDMLDVKDIEAKKDVDYEDMTEAVLYGYDSGWKNFLGGRWRHGVNNSQVWSNYDHNSKVHKTTVRGAGGRYSYSGWTRAGRRASASWEKAFHGNRAWANVK